MISIDRFCDSYNVYLQNIIYLTEILDKTVHFTIYLDFLNYIKIHNYNIHIYLHKPINQLQKFQDTFRILNYYFIYCSNYSS